MKILQREAGNKEILLLDTPTEYLCGPWLSFEYDGQHYLFKNCDKDNPYELLNLKIGNTVTRLTLEFFQQEKLKFRFYADLYFSKTRLNCLYFYSVGNMSELPMTDVKLFNLYDLDIGGLDRYDTDEAYFDEEMAAIVQYDSETSVHVGFTSPNTEMIAHYTAGHPYEPIFKDNIFTLDNTIVEGPTDLFIGMEFDIGDILPGVKRTVPIVVAAGEARQEFNENLLEGKERASRISKVIPRLLEVSDRNTPAGDMVQKMTASLEKKAQKEC